MSDLASAGNTLVRSVPCERCGARMLWTQAAWCEPTGDQPVEMARAAYRCDNGHVVDPSATPQCPHCGLHDTTSAASPTAFECRRCATRFTFPR